MALSQSNGKKRLQQNLDKQASNFDQFCSTEDIAADMWSQTFDKIAASVSPPSTTAASAKAAAKAALAGLSVPATGLAVLVAAANTYASVLGSGMAPVYIATPPVFIPADFGDSSLSLPGVTAATACNLMATKLVTKFSTGTAFLVPFGPVIPWT